VLMFLPQIALLFFFISVLEDSGYLARPAFLMDRMIPRVGLNAHAFIPLLSSFACAIPGIMATRTIRDRRDRLATIMVAPLMTCSARLPVYTLLIAVFFPDLPVLGFFSSRGLILLALYFGGIVAALAVAWSLRNWLLRGERSPLILEMPSYKIPRVRNIGLTVWHSAWEFVKRAGTIILVITILFWFLATHPGPPGEPSDRGARSVQHSYVGQLGTALEPALRPLGFNWKIGVGILSSFAAREVIISTLGTIYQVESGDDQLGSLRQSMLADTDPRTGRPVWSPLVATSLLVFFVFACMCVSTLVTIYSETGKIGWALFVLAYTFALAYLASMAVYQGGLALGFV